MKKQSADNRKLLTALGALLFAVMLLLSALTPLVADDFSYSFTWGENVVRVRSLGQIVSSMAIHRQITNGRVFAHGMVMLLMMLPKAVFNLLNGGNALLLGWLFARYFRQRRGREAALLLAIGAMLLWNFMPVFGQIFLWLDGAVNYSWGISLFLLYLWPYVCRWMDWKEKRSRVLDLLFLLLSFVAGAYSENGSLAALFLALCLTVLAARQGRKPDKRLLAGLVLAALGFVFLMTAPAMHGRAGEMSLSAIAGNVRSILQETREQLLPLYLLYALALALGILRKADSRKLILSGLFVLAGLGSLATFSVALYFAQRHFCFTVFFTVLAVLVLLEALLEQGCGTLPALACACLAVLFVLNFALGCLDILVTFQKSRERVAAIRAAIDAGQQSVTVESYVPDTRYSAPYGLLDLQESWDSWPNGSVALYYGIDRISGVLPGE